ncbi:hypothetical protein CVT91_03295 [Candidatus Atribacteria bacterium HGW-Atribacteria-1]|nr:MAG: hypothetical protein CVT91_03295 [Candidatus Atribacteria bacterium HGW-Atribacteria-1]
MIIFFDYVIVLGVLHHIPNVQFVLSELHRVLKKGGRIVVREPISSMRPKNKWNESDEISPNERGIPISLLKKEFKMLGFRILSISKSYYAPLMRAIKIFSFLEKCPTLIYYIDKICCKLPVSLKYYRDSLLTKCAPGSAYYIAEKSK